MWRSWFLNVPPDVQELLSRTSLETQKLELMAEVSSLKLKLTASEKDRLDYDGRLRDGEVGAPTRRMFPLTSPPPPQGPRSRRRTRTGSGPLPWPLRSRSDGAHVSLASGGVVGRGGALKEGRLCSRLSSSSPLPQGAVITCCL